MFLYLLYESSFIFVLTSSQLIISDHDVAFDIKLSQQSSFTLHFYHFSLFISSTHLYALISPLLYACAGLSYRSLVRVPAQTCDTSVG